MQAERVPYVFTVRAVEFVQGTILKADRVAFVLSVAPSLSDHQITSDALQFTLSTEDVGLEAATGSINIAANTVAYALAVQGVNFATSGGDIKLTAESIPYAVSYKSVGLGKGWAMQALPVAFNLTFGPINIENIVTVRLVNVAGVPRANLRGLRWAWFDTPRPGEMEAPTDQGVVGETDASGILRVSLPNSSLSAGEVGYLVVTDSDGTPSQSPSHKAFSAPLAVS